MSEDGHCGRSGQPAGDARGRGRARRTSSEPRRRQRWKWGAVPLAWLMNGGSFALCVSKTGTTARQPSAGAGRERGVS